MSKNQVLGEPHYHGGQMPCYVQHELPSTLPPTQPRQPFQPHYHDYGICYREHVQTATLPPEAPGTTPQRRVIFGPLLFVFGIIIAIVFLVQGPTAQVPFFGDRDCGASSFDIAAGNVQFNSALSSDRIGRSIIEQCRSGARDNVTWAVLFGIAGIGVGLLTTRYERKR